MASDRPSWMAVLRASLPWFARGSRVFVPLGEALDKTAQTAVDALRLRYPSVTPDARSLTVIGQDRRIPRAPRESAESYARRLVLWLDLWGLAGQPLGLLYACQSFVFPGYPRVRYVSRSGLWWTLEEGASRDMSPFEAATLPCTPEPGFSTSPYRHVPLIGAGTSPRAPFWGHRASPNNWDWDSSSNPERETFWWDFWVIVYPPSWPFGGTFGDGDVYGPDDAYGIEENAGTFATLRELMRLYRRAGSECRGLILAPTLVDFDPEASPGDPDMPDGYWGADAKEVGGVVVPTRRADCRYILHFPG